MRLLADENFPFDAGEALRKIGHDVVWIRTKAPGAGDQEVLERAKSESRILITFDKDFGELAFRSRLPAPCGIVLFRIRIRSAVHVANLAVKVFESRSDWPGNFAVIEDNRIRLRSLPR